METSKKKKNERQRERDVATKGVARCSKYLMGGGRARLKTVSGNDVGPEENNLWCSFVLREEQTQLTV